jgi:hypothetical protein
MARHLSQRRRAGRVNQRHVAQQTGCATCFFNDTLSIDGVDNCKRHQLPTLLVRRMNPTTLSCNNLSEESLA